MENIKFKKGKYYWYQNPHMDDPIKLKLIQIVQFESGEIHELVFKKDDDEWERVVLNKYEIKYVTTAKPKPILSDGYTFEQKVRFFIHEQINEHPSQIYGIIEAIDKKQKEGTINMRFTEEVKDGRSRKFNTSIPLRLKGKEFSYNGITFKFKDVKHAGEEIQESDYNEYVDNYYSLSFSIDYGKNKMEKGGAVKDQGKLNPLDSIKDEYSKLYPNLKWELKNESKTSYSPDEDVIYFSGDKFYPQRFIQVQDYAGFRDDIAKKFGRYKLHIYLHPISIVYGQTTADQNPTIEKYFDHYPSESEIKQELQKKESTYFNKMEKGGALKDQGKFKSLGSIKDLGIKPEVPGHDMVAQCDCGNKFSYQSSKKNMAWKCPVCGENKKVSEDNKKMYYEFLIVKWDEFRTKLLERHMMVVQRQSESSARDVVRKKYPAREGYFEELNSQWYGERKKLS